MLSAQVQAYGIAVTVTFLALILAAGAAAAEKDEGTIGRLRRGLVSFGQLVWAKSLLAAVVGLALGAAIAILFGVVVEIGGVTGGEPWARLPLLFAGVALVGRRGRRRSACCSARSRARRGRRRCWRCSSCCRSSSSGSCRAGRVAVAYWISLFLPFAHAVRWFGAALYDTDPWRTIGIETLWLVGLGLAFGSLARLAMRRLAA